MVAPEYMEVSIIRYRHINHLSETEQNACLRATGFSTTGTHHTFSEWYRRVVFRERYQLPPQTKVKFYEWDAEVNRPDVFTFGSTSYTDACVIIGRELCYWAFSSLDYRKRGVEGCAPINIPHCSCCINGQFNQILDIIAKAKSK